MNAIPLIQRVIAVLWPAFIMAGIATIIFTTAFDPSVIFADQDISRLGFYTITFFVFWIFGISTAAATCYFLKPCQAINKAREKARAEAIEVATEAAKNVAAGRSVTQDDADSAKE